MRYTMLETVRQYGHEKLQEAGEGEWIAAQHLAYYLKLAETSERSCAARTHGMDPPDGAGI